MKKIRRIAVILVVVLLGVGTMLLSARCQTVQVPVGSQLSSYSVEPWRKLLAMHGHDGLFDYAALLKAGSGKLEQYLEAVARFGPDRSPELFPDREARLAYYLNVYNAIMVRKWLDELKGRKESIASATVDTKWFFIELWKVDGHWISLNTLEQKIIRPTFNEPRVHFALVCGAMGCPPLLEEPFEGARLDEQFDGLGRRWLAKPDGLQLAEDGTVKLSSIFDWYRADFDAMGGFEGVLERYLPEADQKRDSAIFAAKEGHLEFMVYDWTINQSP